MTDLPNQSFVLAAALILDASVGDPKWVWSRLPHPAALIGQLTAYLDRHLNQAPRMAFQSRLRGVFALTLIVTLCAGLGWLVSQWLLAIAFGWIAEIVIVSILLAQRSLYLHVKDVAIALDLEGIEAARKAISHIVGRDPQDLDEPAIARASIESLAENLSDGVLAPALFYFVGGLPALLAYKAINTADSMVGYKSDKYLHFGWAAARADDVANFIPARLSALFIALGAALYGTKVADCLKTVWRDADRHASPNAGWPEAAMAAALKLSLNGPRQYNGSIRNDPWLNEEGRKEATAADIYRALKIFAAACGFHLGIVATFSAVTSF